MRATWLNIPAFCDKVKSTYGPDADAGDPIADYQDARSLVVLDDLFGRELTPHEAGQIVNRLLDVAYQNGAALLVTLNQTHKELAAILPQHEILRLLSHAAIIPVSSIAEEDWRSKK